MIRVSLHVYLARCIRKYYEAMRSECKLQQIYIHTMAASTSVLVQWWKKNANNFLAHSIAKLRHADVWMSVRCAVDIIAGYSNLERLLFDGLHRPCEQYAYTHIHRPAYVYQTVLEYEHFYYLTHLCRLFIFR